MKSPPQSRALPQGVAPGKQFVEPANDAGPGLPPRPRDIVVESSVDRQARRIREIAAGPVSSFSSALAAPNATSIAFRDQNGGMGFFLRPDSPDEPVFGVTAQFAHGGFSSVYGATERLQPELTSPRRKQAVRLSKLRAHPHDARVEYRENIYNLLVVRKTKILAKINPFDTGSTEPKSTDGETKVSNILQVLNEVVAQAAVRNRFAPLAFYTLASEWDFGRGVPTAIYTVSRMAQGDLFTLRPGRSSTREEILTWLLTAAVSLSGQLADLHATGRQHNDIKPDNILVDLHSAELFHLADFGLVTEISNSSVQGGWQGTPLYWSPEAFDQGESRPIGPSVDAWALGLTLFDLATDLQRYARTRGADSSHSAVKEFSWTRDLKRNGAQIGTALDADQMGSLIGAPIPTAKMPAFNPLVAVTTRFVSGAAPETTRFSPTANGLRWLANELPPAAALIFPLLSDRAAADKPLFMASYQRYAQKIGRQLYARELGPMVAQSSSDEASSMITATVREQVRDVLYGKTITEAGAAYQRRLFDVATIPNVVLDNFQEQAA